LLASKRTDQRRTAAHAARESQADWYEAWAELRGEQVKLQVFSLRGVVSRATFHRAYHRATQQAFLDAQEHKGIELGTFSPSKPNQNAFIKRF
jgi:predicted kinase